MGIKIGRKEVEEIMYGNKIVLDVYHGSNHIYEREPRTDYDESTGELFINDTVVISDTDGDILLSREIIKENN